MALTGLVVFGSTENRAQPDDSDKLGMYIFRSLFVESGAGCSKLLAA
jgi:hypothetical protein